MHGEALHSSTTCFESLDKPTGTPNAWKSSPNLRSTPTLLGLLGNVSLRLLIPDACTACVLCLPSRIELGILARFDWAWLPVARSSLDGLCSFLPTFLPFITWRRICLLASRSGPPLSTNRKAVCIVIVSFDRGTGESSRTAPGVMMRTTRRRGRSGDKPRGTPNALPSSTEQRPRSAPAVLVTAQWRYKSAWHPYHLAPRAHVLYVA